MDWIYFGFRSRVHFTSFPAFSTKWEFLQWENLCETINRLDSSMHEWVYRRWYIAELTIFITHENVVLLWFYDFIKISKFCKHWMHYSEEEEEEEEGGEEEEKRILSSYDGKTLSIRCVRYIRRKLLPNEKFDIHIHFLCSMRPCHDAHSSNRKFCLDFHIIFCVSFLRYLFSLRHHLHVSFEWMNDGKE